ncbi:MAG: hypothetical protein L6W00_14845 [Lentisphaeria bacterium]|nr:MAG: hypothetical protein L6W00_14845 [Lentisphaeria bacterium]
MTDLEFLKSFFRRSRFSSLYLWSDAWILTALLLQDRNPIPLGAVIFAADWLNHAIPTPYEVNHALTLLSANGFLTLDANRNLLLTDRAKVFKNDSFLKARHFNKIDVIHKELMLNPPLSCLSVNEFFTQDDIKHAREEFAREAFGRAVMNLSDLYAICCLLLWSVSLGIVVAMLCMGRNKNAEKSGVSF